MSRYTLTVLPDGHCLLSAERPIEIAEARALIASFDKWRETPGGLAIIADCRIQHATSLEIDLPTIPEAAT